MKNEATEEKGAADVIVTEDVERVGKQRNKKKNVIWDIFRILNMFQNRQRNSDAEQFIRILHTKYFELYRFSEMMR